ncbi:hypothetical protein [Paludibacter sp.]|uniref:fibronectin type III domain-containing protein n=1 Tax=Paludibacter sp. TaxID=1898105 RepID=UPI0013549D05|nr:hypothetical protein [Paludibacter sp.]MTK54367.1 hypothetical protein [Paludibacter sp.]
MFILNKTTKVFVIFAIYLFCGFTHLYAKGLREDSASIDAIGSIDSCHCSIRLRWGLNNPSLWKLSNSCGYVIERYTVSRNGQLLSTPEKRRLTTIPLKPLPLKEWESICQTDNNAAILAQGIYGEDFDVSATSGKLEKIVTKSNNLTQRHTFSLMAADGSFKAACMAALGYVDSAIHKGEKYLYKIYPAIPKGKLQCDTALVYIGSDDPASLPKPADIYAAYGDKTVLLSWDTKSLRSFYSSYRVERSSDGVTFNPLSNLPFSTLNDNEKQETGRSFYMDTIQNNQVFHYRVKGVTPFGDMGPPSEVVAGSGRTMMAFAPNIKDADIVNDSTVVLTWEFPEEGVAVVDHFELCRSINNVENSFQTVVPKIDVSQRKIRFSPLSPSNYFIVVAVDKQGNKRSSFPFLVQPVDSIPPAIPTGLTAQIDSLGKVTLTWKANRESDLKGYLIFKSNNKKEEPSLVDSKLTFNCLFQEKVDLNTLNGSIYYSVAAIDRRMNQSKPSPPIEVTKPDKIPPTTPFLTECRITDKGNILLSWINSSSEDVASHLLLRKTEKDSVWTTIARITDLHTTAFEDTLSSPNGKALYYSLCALDKSRNLSDFSPVLKIISPQRNFAPQIKNLRADIDRNKNSITVSWRIIGSGIEEYTIYKAKNNEPYTTWKTLSGNQLFVTDAEISVGNTYHYALRSTLQGGKPGEWKEIKIEY